MLTRQMIHVLEDLQLSTLDVRRHGLKNVLMYKILNERSKLRDKFIKIKDLVHKSQLSTVQHFRQSNPYPQLSRHQWTHPVKSTSQIC
jgi:UTP-glucose-1-phosphate uridylyltransferase